MDLLEEGFDLAIRSGVLPDFVATPALADRRLVPVLPSWATRRVDVHAVFPSHKSLSPALRAFVDLAVERLGASLKPAGA